MKFRKMHVAKFIDLFIYSYIFIYVFIHLWMYMYIFFCAHILYLHFLSFDGHISLKPLAWSGFWGKRNRSRQLKNEAIGEGSCAGKAKVA